MYVCTRNSLSSQQGNLVHMFLARGGDIGEFRGPTGVSLDSDGLIYIVDLPNHRVRVF